MTDHRCPDCQSPLESGALDGLCPRCLAGLLFDPGPVPDASMLAEEMRASTPPMTTRSVLLEFPGYEVTRELARGGMGIVYQATQLEPRREVALKMLLPHQLEAETFRERFLLEARAIARLEHPHILPVYQVGEYDGVPFFTMKLAAGGTLAERRTRYRRSWREIAELVAILADAVQYAHDRGVLHRDLKPGNVLFDDTGRAYVSDFGLAKLADDAMPEEEPGQVIGTPRYVAPEVAGQGSELATVASDIYGLGIILYELLAQKAPFAALSQQALLRMVADAPAPPPGVELRGVPHELDIISMRCLEKDPDRRLQSAGALARELRRWLSGSPIESLPATRQEHFWRWLRQQQAVVGLTVAIAVLGLVLVVGSVWVAFSLAASRQAVVEERDRARGDLVLARLGEARGLRLSGRIRTRARALELLSGAAQAEARVELRNEAAAVLGRWDVGPEEDRHRHSGVGLPVTLSDGLDLVADARPDGEVRVWRRATGSTLWKHRSATGRPIFTLAFSRAGRWLAVADEAGVRVLDGSNGSVVFEQAGQWLGFSADDHHAVVAGRDRQIGFREMPSGRLVRAFPLPESAVGALAVSDGPGPSQVLVQWKDHLEVIDPMTGASVRWLPFYRGDVRAVVWRNGFLLVGDQAGGLRLWNLRSGRFRDLAGHRNPIRRLVLSPDGGLAWSVSDDGQTCLWQGRTGQLLGQSELWQPLLFSADGARLVYLDGAEFGIARMQRPVGLTSVPLRGGKTVRHVEFSPDGQWVVAVGQSGVSLIEPVLGQVVHSSPIYGAVSAHFEPKGKRLAVVHRLGIRWFDLREVGRRMTLVPAGEIRPPRLAWLGRSVGDGDDRTLLIPDGDGSLLRFDLVDQEWLPLQKELESARGATIDPAGRWLAVESEGLRLSVIPVGGGKRVLELEPGAGSPSFSPDGRHLLVAGGEMHRVFSTHDWRPSLAEPTGAGSTTPGMGRWSRYGRAFAVASPRSGVLVLSTESWRPVVRLDSGLPISSLAFDPHGRRIAAGTDDDHVLLWSLPGLRQALAPLGLAWTENISPEGNAVPPAGAAGIRDVHPIDPTLGRILSRGPASRPEAMDLGCCLNEPLDAAEEFFSGPRDRPYAMPVGSGRFDGVEFDVRGYIRLAGLQEKGGRGLWPAATEEVPVARAVSGLAILMTAMAEGPDDREGHEICRFRVRWQDGSEQDWPFRFGDEVGPWLADPIHGGFPRATVAWEGLSELGESLQKVNRLYVYRWKNTRPGVPVDRISWVGGGRSFGLRIAGVTVLSE